MPQGISTAQAGNALGASIAQSARNANINSAWIETLLMEQHSKVYIDGGANMNPLSGFVTHNEDQFGGFIQMYGIHLPTAHFANSPSRTRDVNPALIESPSVVSEIIKKERSAMFVFTVDESEATKISKGEEDLAAFIEANTARLYDGNAYDEYQTLKLIASEAIQSGTWTKDYVPASTPTISYIADHVYLNIDKFLLPSADFNPYGLIMSTDSVESLRFVTTAENKLEINKYLGNIYHKDLLDLNVETNLMHDISEVWIYPTDHTVVAADFVPNATGVTALDPVVWSINDVVKAGSYAQPGATDAVPVLTEKEGKRILGFLVDERAFGLRDRRAAALYPEQSNRGLITNIYLHVRQWAYASGLVNTVAFVTELTEPTVTQGVTGTFVAGTDDRTIKFTATTEKVGDYVEFTINGETVVGNVAVVNGADSYATVVL
jgi:hypothetical protein